MEHCSFVDYKGIYSKTQCHHSNGLDFLDIEIFKMKKDCLSTSAQVCQLTQASRKNMTISTKIQEAHVRLGHVNFETIKEMSSKGTIEGLPKIETLVPMISRTCFHIYNQSLLGS